MDQFSAMSDFLLNYPAHKLAFGRNFPNKLDDLRDDLEGNSDPKDHRLKQDTVTYLQDLE
jgi:hypothetical protein